LMGHKVEKLGFVKSTTGPLRVNGVQVYSRETPQDKFVVKATRETILAAGAVHTPQILMLSGIGAKKILKEAGIDVKLDLEGVGFNLMDHPQVRYSCECKSSINGLSSVFTYVNQLTGQS